MIIGIDIDDTVAKTNSSLLELAIRYDKEKLGGKGFKNKDAYSLKELFYWTDADVSDFMQTIRDGNLFNEVSPVRDSVLYINKLYDLGYKIYFITRRKNTAHMLKVTMKWLEKYGFKYHKLILGMSEKGRICKSELVDLFIDNDIKHVKEVLDQGIDAILMGDNYNKDEADVRRVTTWEEVYDYVAR